MSAAAAGARGRASGWWFQPGLDGNPPARGEAQSSLRPAPAGRIKKYGSWQHSTVQHGTAQYRAAQLSSVLSLVALCALCAHGLHVLAAARHPPAHTHTVQQHAHTQQHRAHGAAARTQSSTAHPQSSTHTSAQSTAAQRSRRRRGAYNAVRPSTCHQPPMEACPCTRLSADAQAAPSASALLPTNAHPARKGPFVPGGRAHGNQLLTSQPVGCPPRPTSPHTTPPRTPPTHPYPSLLAWQGCSW
jgi:hypothetical protein